MRSFVEAIRQRSSLTRQQSIKHIQPVGFLDLATLTGKSPSSLFLTNEDFSEGKLCPKGYDVC
jgi:hypothetical protein